MLNFKINEHRLKKLCFVFLSLDQVLKKQIEKKNVQGRQISDKKYVTKLFTFTNNFMT